MPPKKKKISKEDKASETYFKVDEKSITRSTEKKASKEKSRDEFLKGSTEKIVKNSNIENIESHSVHPKLKNKGRSDASPKTLNSKRKKAKKTTTKREVYIIPKILLKENGFELIITEKPQAALKIATALGDTTKRELYRGVPYYEVDRKGEKIVVACAVGHLFTLKQKEKGFSVPIFNIDWVPNYLARKGDYTKKYYDTILRLAKNAGSITVATDYDIEGEVIGTNVVRLICNQKDAKRMKFSTLTTKELNEAYDKKEKSIHWGHEIAGETRHFLDWYYGINLSRALMNAIKTTGKFKIMSIGRVQGPTLALIVKKEKEIQAFEPEPYWQIFITIDKNNLELKYVKDIFFKEELKVFKNLVGKTGIAETKKRKETILPHIPFNLTGLQTESYKLYGINPANSLRAAQSLYLAGLISYPRTSSQKLPEAIDYKSILTILKERYKVSKLIVKDKPIEGKKEDPAHPSIYPTGNKPPVLSGDEEKIYELIVKRFLCLFCDAAIVERKRVTVNVNKLIFSKNGSEIKKQAWMKIYPSKTKEEEIPDIKGEVGIVDKRIEDKETQPPRRYSPASILSELEKRNLGTKATRASILDTLYDRGYIKEQSIQATDLGISLIETLDKYSPIIINEDLTKELQDEMDLMAEKNTKPIEDSKRVIEKVKKTIIDIAKDFEKNEIKIGSELMDAQLKQRAKDKEANKLIKCPKCNSGYLAITYSPKNKKFFVACNAYPKCKTTYSLPPKGTIKKVGKNCEKCGFPLLMALTKGRKPWIFCFNTECETNRERVEAYRKSLKEKNN
ncbi:MAG: DNA topoisomerase I [Nanoarchaeota archaeon]|nr:DNA topoisomerase I [Nanoarchaeota archaeon]